MAPDTVERSHPPSSLVILELGSRSVSAVLCDVVAGRHRLVASADSWQTSADSGPLDAAERAFRGLEASSGRRLLGGHGVVVPTTHDGVGCDLLLVSGGKPLRALVLSFGKVASSVLDTIDSSVVELLPLLSVEDAIEERLGLVGEVATALRDYRPDVLLLVGGTEASSFPVTTALAGMLSTIQTCHPGGLPTVLLAAPSAVRERVVADLRLRARRALDAVPTVQQTEIDGLSNQLLTIWRDYYSALPFWRALASGEESRPVPRLESIGQACQALSRSKGAPIWAIEVGDSDVIVLRATPDRIAMARRSIPRLAFSRDVGELDEWLARPWLTEIDRPSIEHQRELTVRAIAEVAGEIRSLGRSEALPALVVGRGVGLIQRLPPTDAAVAMCLGIGLTGQSTVALDRHGVLAGAGLLLERYPDAGVDLIRDALDDLGVVVIGRTFESESARVQIEGVSTGAKAPSDVLPHEVTVLSSIEWTNSEIALNPSRTVDIGSGDGRRGQVSLGESEVGVMLTISTERGTRRWARGQGMSGGLGALLRRST